MKRAVTAAVLGVGLGALAWSLLRNGSIRTPLVFCLVAGLATAMAVWAVSSAWSPPDLVESTVTAQEHRDRPPSITELVTLEQQLSWGSVDADRFDSRVRPLLIELATSRLWHHHGIDPAHDPDRARLIVGESLWTLMTMPANQIARAPSQRGLARLAADLERI